MYSVSGTGNFYDGVDFHFFKHREPPEMPAEIDPSKRAIPLERSVRQKFNPQGKAGNDGGEREVESGDADNGAESDDGLDDTAMRDSRDPSLCLPDMLGFKDKIATPAAVGSIWEEKEGQGWRAKTMTAPYDGTAELQMRPIAEDNGEGEDEKGVDVGARFGSDGEDDCGGDESGDDAAGDGGCNTGTPNPTDVQRLSSSCEQLIGWSELLMIDLIQAYFRYYAHSKGDYTGRTFNHRNQVSALCCLVTNSRNAGQRFSLVWNLVE